MHGNGLHLTEEKLKCLLSLVNLSSICPLKSPKNVNFRPDQSGVNSASPKFWPCAKPRRLSCHEKKSKLLKIPKMFVKPGSFLNANFRTFLKGRWCPSCPSSFSSSSPQYLSNRHLPKCIRFIKNFVVVCWMFECKLIINCCGCYLLLRSETDRPGASSESAKATSSARGRTWPTQAIQY